MMKNGSFAVAVVQRQVVLVQAARSHSKRDKHFEVTPYIPFGGSRIFLSLSGQHTTRIASTDVLSFLPTAAATTSPSTSCAGGYIDSDTESDYGSESHLPVVSSKDVDVASMVGEGTVELPEHAFAEYVRLSEQHYNRPRSASRSAKIWTSLVGRAASVRT